MWNQAKAKALAWLLSPHSIAEFSSVYYERAPLLIKRKKADYYRAYFSLAELERGLYGSQMTPSFLRVAKNGADLRVEAYTQKVQTTDRASRNTAQIDVIDPYRVSALFAQGCTVVVENLQRCCAPIAKLNASLEAFFGHQTFAGYFLTPAGSRGLPLHFDTIDTMVLQIEGKKRWRVYDATLELPLHPHQRSDKKKYDVGALRLDVELEAGDFLYLPRGTFHEPATDPDSFSLHVSIGLLPIRWNDVLERALFAAALAGPDLRRSTHVPLDDASLRQTLASAFSKENLEDILAQMEGEYLASHGNLLDGQLRQVLDAESVTMASIVALRGDALYDITEDEKSAVLKAFGTELPFPRSVVGILRELALVESAPVSALAQCGEDALGVVRRLIRAGLVVQLSPVAPEAGHAVA